LDREDRDLINHDLGLTFPPSPSPSLPSLPPTPAQCPANVAGIALGGAGADGPDSGLEH